MGVSHWEIVMGMWKLTCRRNWHSANCRATLKKNREDAKGVKLHLKSKTIFLPTEGYNYKRLVTYHSLCKYLWRSRELQKCESQARNSKRRQQWRVKLLMERKAEGQSAGNITGNHLQHTSYAFYGWKSLLGDVAGCGADYLVHWFFHTLAFGH